jgi:acyl carrier protein
MDFEKVVTSVFADITRGKEFNKDMQIKDLGIDSLDLVEIVLAAEDEFGITFSDEELNSFKTVKDVCTVLDSKK